MDKIKILGVCYEDPEVKIGGMGRHVGELYRHMAMRDDVDIHLLTSGPDVGPKQHDGYTKHYTDKLVAYKPRNPNLPSHLFADIQAARTLMKLLAEGATWDVVHIHDWNCVQVGRAMRDALGIPMVGTMHLSLTHLMETGGVYDQGVTEDELYTMQMEGHLVADTDKLILCSWAFARIVRQVFMIERPVDVIPNGIDVGYWRPVEASEDFKDMYGIPRGRKIALFVGRIADMKGIREILEAVEAEDNGYCIVLCGDVNADTDEIKESWDVTVKIRELEARYPNRLRWVGFHNDETLRKFYSIANVGLMPSVHEPFGIVALEFMAMGVPLICSERDGLREIVIDGDGEEYALIIEPTAKQINQALKQISPWSTGSDLAIQGFRRAKQFDWHTVAKQTVEVYRRVVHDHADRCNNSKEYQQAQSPGC